jgi:ADP-ribose pyrophosphatase YjhB (NUDIX family)
MATTHSYGLACFIKDGDVDRLIFGERAYTYAFIDWTKSFTNLDNGFEFLCGEIDKMTELEKTFCQNMAVETICDLTKITYPSPDYKKKVIQQYKNRMKDENFYKDIIKYIKTDSPFNHNNEQCKYDIPKGHKNNKKAETDISCAKREFKEETGIKNVDVCDDIPPVSFSFSDVRDYCFTYYIAFTGDDYLKNAKKLRSQREIVNLHALSYDEVCKMNHMHRNQYIRIFDIWNEKKLNWHVYNGKYNIFGDI